MSTHKKRRKLLRSVHQLMNFTESPSDEEKCMIEESDEDMLSRGTYICQTSHEAMGPDSSDSDHSLIYASSDDVSSIDRSINLSDELKNLITQYPNIPNSFIKSILSILRKFDGSLPLDPRTLLGSSCHKHSQEIRTVNPGKYYHFGVINGIRTLVNDGKLESDTLTLQFNVDGLPPFKSTTTSFWPILCSVIDIPNSVFVVGIYYGPKKPLHANDFLIDFSNELKDILEYGITIENRNFNTLIDGFCCDTPARSFVKCTKSHTGYFGCDRCEQKGVVIDNRMTFPEMDVQRRNNQSFRSQVQDKHHNSTSIFTNIPNIDMVMMFPIDYMHSVCKGIVITLLEGLRRGPLPYRCNTSNIEQISSSLLRFRKFIPSDFARKPRSLNHLALWKATESRLFCLYLAPIVLKNHVHDHFYQMFMTLTLLMRILCHPQLVILHNGYCKELARTLVSQVAEVLGDRVTYNIHSILHLVEDCEKRGCADKFSCFQYESFLSKLKKVVRSPYRPLEQVLNKISIVGPSLGVIPGNPEALVLQRVINHSFIPRQVKDADGFDNACQFYMKIVINSILLKVNSADSFVMFKDHLLHLKWIMKGPKGIFLVGSSYEVQEFSDFPALTLTGVSSTTKAQKRENEFIPLSDVVCKCICYPSKNKYNILPILHTYGRFHIEKT